jgi:hypothetical protein
MKNIILIIFLLIAVQSQAQFDSTQRALIGKFQQLREGIVQKQADFINKNDSIFIQFLKKSWKSVFMMQGLTTENKKPVEQPVIKDIKKQEEVEIIEIDTTQIIDIDNESVEEHESALMEDTAVSYGAQTVLQQFSFFGNREKIYDWPSLKPTFKDINENGIIDFYAGITKQNAYWLNDVALLNKLREKYSLNDWGYYQLVKNASMILFNNANEQRLFAWYVFIKSGYDVKVGYDQSEVFLMLPSIHKLFGRQYYIDEEAIYYLADITKNKISNLKTYDAKYPGSTNVFDFELTHHPSFEGQPIKKKISYKGKTSELIFEKSELDFLSTYPQCELKLYFKCGITSENLTSLDELLLPEIKGKSNREIIDIIIDFIQNTIGYATDEEQFGKERYLFAEESLFYPKNDCEDRTIFMAFLVKRYTGLSTVALDFPGHVTLAVNLPNAGNGNFISFKGERYLVCDPTYINAKSGMIPDQYKSMKAKIVSYN